MPDRIGPAQILGMLARRVGWKLRPRSSVRWNAYVNYIGLDFSDGEFCPGVLALASPNASARQVVDGCAFPNGMVVTHDNMTLIFRRVLW